ncbi:MAG TPA: helix-turn-helix transcriptional regulator [Streptosporangiaceae bacterium]|jgi:hypothetical protein
MGGGRGRGVSSYTKWARAGYIERADGAEQAEQRRKVLMAPQSGFRLAEERKRHGFTQAQLAKAMGVTPGRVSQILYLFRRAESRSHGRAERLVGLADCQCLPWFSI